jgi:ATP-dependent 26S proteasome regulatory subunit
MPQPQRSRRSHHLPVPIPVPHLHLPHLCQHHHPRTNLRVQRPNQFRLLFSELQAGNQYHLPLARRVNASYDQRAAMKATNTVAPPRSTGTGNTSKEYVPPTVRLSDLGGVDPCTEKMLELMAMPLTHPEVYIHTGVQPPRGVLLHGPPGCGKTMFANAIADRWGTWYSVHCIAACAN